jgi:hypothetical protein
MRSLRDTSTVEAHHFTLVQDRPYAPDFVDWDYQRLFLFPIPW